MELHRNTKIVVRLSIDELLSIMKDFNKLLLLAPSIIPKYDKTNEGFVKAELRIANKSFKVLIRTAYKKEDISKIIMSNIKGENFSIDVIIKLIPYGDNLNITVGVRGQGDIDEETMNKIINELESYIVNYIQALTLKPRINFRFIIRDYRMKILESPNLLENEVFLSRVILSSILTKTINLELPLNELFRFIDTQIIPVTRGNFTYINFRNDVIIRLLIDPEATLLGIRIDFKDGISLNGFDAISYILKSSNVVKGRLYVFRTKSTDIITI